jgi:sterol desaturase/sphingolipid hydroxylase (fatty acid hydroxylase superfamily)
MRIATPVGYTIYMYTGLEMILWFLLGVPFVEFLGYWVHRLIFHHGMLGAYFRKRHVKHHLEDYPIELLRPEHREYKSAADPLWHVIGGLILIILLVLIATNVLNAWQGGALALGSVLYAKYVVSWMHMQFHVVSSPLKHSTYFQKLVLFHDVHHYVRANYGIVFMGMDRVFGTFVREVPTRTENIFPDYIQ